MSTLGTKASDLLVHALEAEGVERIFTVSGEENLDLVKSPFESSITLVLTRHQQGAGVMANRSRWTTQSMKRPSALHSSTRMK